ncbi:MAG: D-glycero-beta-D-manno-heptose 1,7-bisphosphate 7-phosphatase [Anaerolineae bacterium]|nr:D-glycero-beta-D-manno-heptose 1,7-bisphosphate 7-phosphatase [Anaerolineae bacterium]MDW8071983.1 D-glycero-beta-D-manno-heptose 1,7-bisphosphate 7-phosphatase [Anaerolineae bacterium]
MGARRAIFLDRDGVINENRSDYVKSLAEFVFLPGALEALQRLAKLDMSIVVISNQSAINRGLVTRAVVDAITQAMRERIEAAGGRVDAVFYCPHRPDEGCTCRKPQPGLFHQAALQLGIQLVGSYVIGDALSDVQAALRVGAQPIMVLTGRGREQVTLLDGSLRSSTPVFDDLLAAARWVWQRENGRWEP